MRHRILIREPVKVIGVTACGSFNSDITLLPKKNVFVRAHKESYNSENKEKYRAYSKVIANKVKEFRALKETNKQLDILVKKNTARVVEKIFTDAINNTKEE